MELEQSRPVVTAPVIDRPSLAWGLLLRKLSPYLFIAPAMIVIVVFVFLPLIRTVQISFYDYRLINNRQTYIGLENYQRILSDGRFGEMFVQSLAFLGIAVISSTLLPISLALLTLRMTERELDVYQSLLFLPVMIAASVAMQVWIYFYLPIGGLFNTLLITLGLQPVQFLSDPRVALPAVAVAANWKVLGFHFLLALAGLKAIPRDYLEAAYVDGASGWSLVRHIVLPLFAPTMLFIFIITLIQGLDAVFTPIEVMTQGGPAGATNNLMYGIYQDGFKYFRAGMASALSVVLIVIFGGLIYLQYRLFDRRITYER